MARDLDTEDRVRELKGYQQWADMLTTSEPFQWFLGLVTQQMERARADIESGDIKLEHMHQRIGEIRACRRVLKLVESEHRDIGNEIVKAGGFV